MDPAESLSGTARAVLSLAPAVADVDTDVDELESLQAAVRRGYFTPQEDEIVRARFALYLTARAALLEVIDDLRPIALGKASRSKEFQIRAFTIGYTAACLLVRAGRYLVQQIAGEPVLRAKLDEAEPRFRIPAGQFSAVYRSTTNPKNAWRLANARRFADENREAIEALSRDPEFGKIVEHLRRSERTLDISPTHYLKARMRFRLFSFRRRRISGYHKVMFAVLEGSGRLFSNLRDHWRTKRVLRLKKYVEGALKPGDVIVTRHEAALTNLFLPGFWPHVALYIGPSSGCKELGLSLDADRADRWKGSVRVLEARKDGVLFRPLEETLNVDYVAVIRPTLSLDQIGKALSRAVTHEGKLYDFGFDFSRADRMVCTEVVYRAYDGIGGLRITPTLRAGRMTVSAEDLLDLAIDRKGFEPVALYGTSNAQRKLITGDDVAEKLLQTYRSPTTASTDQQSHR